LERCADAWRTLEAEAGAGGLAPFQRLAWARAWLRTVGAGCEPWMLRARDRHATLLPLVLVRRRGIRILRFLGHGVSDYLGPVPLNASAEALRSFGLALAREARGFDLLDLQSFHAEPERRHALAEALGLAIAERLYERCPVIDTTGDWPAYLASRRKKFRANLKRAERRVGEQGALAIQQEQATAALFEEMVAVERDSWKWTLGSAFLREESHRRFLAAVLLEDRVPSECWTLRLDGALAAFAVVFPGADRRYYYLPSFRERHPDVGTRLLAAIVRDTFDGPWREFDFLRGDEGYKLAWCQSEREVHQLVAAGRTPLGAAALATVRVRWRLARSHRIRALRAAFLRRGAAQPASDPAAASR
jgi:CelD/BcsL family acetyltransferase involved in cellulose biosynthesis